MADDPASRKLDPEQIRALDALGTRRRVAAGEYLYREGDAEYDFYVVLSGAGDIVVGSGDDERLLAHHESGSFLGELNLLTGLRVFVSARVSVAGEVIVVPVAALRHVIATQPSLSDVILAAFIARRSGLMTGAASAIRVIGSRFSPESGRVREFLQRTRIPHEWLDADSAPEVEALLQEFGVEPNELPVVIA